MTDEALRGKLSALYTFEEDFTIHDYRCAAVDPFTGEAVGENGTYGAGAACAAISRGHSARAFRTGSAPLTLPAPAEGGVSLSFWAYNEEVLAGAQQTGASVGYSSLLRAEGIAVGWGSLTVGGLPLSPADAQLGSAAYTPARLQAASAALGEDLLWQPPAAAGNGYYSPNAVSGGYEGPEGTEAERAMAASQAGRWRYITVTLSAAEGVRFYVDGQLAYAYDAQLLDLYASFAGTSWSALCAGATGELSLFGEPTGVLADDLIVGEALTAAEVLRLYEDLTR